MLRFVKLEQTLLDSKSVHVSENDLVLLPISVEGSRIWIGNVYVGSKESVKIGPIEAEFAKCAQGLKISAMDISDGKRMKTHLGFYILERLAEKITFMSHGSRNTVKWNEKGKVYCFYKKPNHFYDLVLVNFAQCKKVSPLSDCLQGDNNGIENRLVDNRSYRPKPVEMDEISSVSKKELRNNLDGNNISGTKRLGEEEQQLVNAYNREFAKVNPSFLYQ